VDDRTKDRVRKLLALASNNPSIEEAAVAFARAQEIATAAGLDLDDLGSDEPIEPPRTVESMTSEQIDSWDKAVPWKVTICHAVARANSCGTFHYPGRGGGPVAYGQPSDLATVKYLYHAIVQQVETMAAEAIRAYKANPDADPRWDESPRTYGRSWRLGCADAISQRLPRPEAVVQKVRASIAGQVTGDRSTALVRVDRAADLVASIAVARETFKKGLGLRAGSGFTGARSAGGYSAGRAAGARVSLGNSGRALKGGRDGRAHALLVRRTMAVHRATERESVSTRDRCDARVHSDSTALVRSVDRAGLASMPHVRMRVEQSPRDRWCVSPG
jgi:hypothetical protein